MFSFDDRLPPTTVYFYRSIDNIDYDQNVYKLNYLDTTTAVSEDKLQKVPIRRLVPFTLLSRISL
jgi:hypothetical protein